MVTVEDRIASLEQRIARIEGILEQISIRLSEVERRLDTKADKWELRIWFMLIITLLGVILSRFLVS